MRQLQRDGIHLLLGMTVAFASLAAVATFSGVVLSIVLTITSTTISTAIRGAVGSALEGILLSGAIMQAIGWLWLPRIGFVSQRLGQSMSIAMAAIALFMLAMVLFSL